MSSGKDYENIFSLKMVGMMYLCCMIVLVPHQGLRNRSTKLQRVRLQSCSHFGMGTGFANHKQINRIRSVLTP